jgi:hypothetical protein
MKNSGDLQESVNLQNFSFDIFCGTSCRLWICEMRKNKTKDSEMRPLSFERKGEDVR